MNIACRFSLHSWETIEKREIRKDSYLRSHFHENLLVGNSFTNQCRRCGKVEEKTVYYTEKEILLGYLLETADKIETTAENLKHSQP